jgi:hypothetical protein
MLGQTLFCTSLLLLPLVEENLLALRVGKFTHDCISAFISNRTYKDPNNHLEITLKIDNNTLFYVCQSPTEREELAVVIEQLMEGKIPDESDVTVASLIVVSTSSSSSSSLFVCVFKKLVNRLFSKQKK